MEFFDRLRARAGSWRAYRDYQRRCAAFRKTGSGAPRAGGAPAVNLPQAEEDFEPPLFMPTTRKPNRSEMDQLAIKTLYLALYRTMKGMGYAVNECGNPAADTVFSWSEKRAYPHVAPERKVYMELGWLPRTTFQISTSGVNTRSHVAEQFAFKPLAAQDRERTLRYLAHMRESFGRGIDAANVERVREAAQTPFILFAFQLSNDFNLKYSSSVFQDYYDRSPEGNIRFAQACVELVEKSAPPLPVVFKQHPSDRSAPAERVKLGSPSNRFWAKTENLSTHEVFASGLCRLVISVNSNTTHEAAAWGIPAVCLGNLIWTDRTDPRPFPGTLDNLQAVIDRPVEDNAVCLAYLNHLLRNQWRLDDFQNPLMVKTLVETRGLCEPFALREEVGFCL